MNIPRYVVIPGGSFLMGGIPEDKFVSAVELPLHEVTVAAFGLGVFPVTAGEWHDVTGAHPSNEDPALPVTCVTFAEAKDYLKVLSERTALSFRMPSEAEWEYACRAGSASVFPHSNRLTEEDANFLYDESGVQIGLGSPTPVGRYQPNAFGLHDMTGNVCEWTEDLWHADFQHAPDDGSAWLGAGKPGCRVIRGGGWDHLPRVLRASWRDWAPEEAHWDNLGFRVAVTL